MKLAIFAGVLALSFATAPAWAEPANPIDGRFAAMASIGNSFEIAASRLALQRATQPDLLAFARMMIEDHRMAESKLDAAAVPSGAEAGSMLDSEHYKMLQDLSALSGADFDQAYATDQLAAHREAVQILSDYIESGEDPNLHRYASDTLPVVAMHLRRMEAISAM